MPRKHSAKNPAPAQIPRREPCRWTALGFISRSGFSSVLLSQLKRQFPIRLPPPFLKIFWKEGVCLDHFSAPGALTLNPSHVLEALLLCVQDCLSANDLGLLCLWVILSVHFHCVSVFFLSVHLGCQLILVHLFFKQHERSPWPQL